MNKFLALLTALMIPFVANTSKANVGKTTDNTMTERKSEFVKDAQRKLDDMATRVNDLQTSGNLASTSKSDEAKDKAEELKEDIADLKQEVRSETDDVSADDWDSARANLQNDINALEQEVKEFSGLYR